MNRKAREIAEVLNQKQLKVKPGEVKGMPFEVFLTEHIITDKREPFSFKNCHPLEFIAKNLHRWEEVAISKGYQTYFTTLFLAYAFWLCSQGADVGYCIPSKTDGRKFYDRFERTRKRDKTLKRFVKGKRSEGKFNIAENFFYLIGLWDLTDAISVPLDLVMEDEVDFLDAKAREWIGERLGASEKPQHFWFCRGELPGQGINYEYTESDRTRWMVSCKCGHRFNIEKTFEAAKPPELPACIEEAEGEYYYKCPECGKRIDIYRQGKWEAEYPEKSEVRRGFRYPRLLNAPGGSERLKRIIREYLRIKTKRKWRIFCGGTLAIPKGGDLAGITDDHLRLCAVDYEFVRQAHWSVCGIDQGDYWHAVFLGPGKDKPLRVLLALQIFGDEVEKLMTGYKPGAEAPEDYGLLQKMNALVTVCDSKPERSPVRRMARRIPNFHPHDYKGDQDREVEKDFEGEVFEFIQTGREETLELVEELFDENNPGIEIPAEIEGEDICLSEFGRQLKEGAVKEEVETRTGTDIQYKHGGNNHYFHALNYALIAYRRLGNTGGCGYGVAPVCGGNLLEGK